MITSRTVQNCSEDRPVLPYTVYGTGVPFISAVQSRPTDITLLLIYVPLSVQLLKGREGNMKSCRRLSCGRFLATVSSL